jgi:hypothetical protein
MYKSSGGLSLNGTGKMGLELHEGKTRRFYGRAFSHGCNIGYPHY